MTQWYYSIKFEKLGEDEKALTEKISRSLGYGSESYDENPRWDCNHTAYEDVIEPILKEVCFSGSIVSDGEIAGYPVQVWTLEEGVIRLIEEYNDIGCVIREEEYDKNGSLVSTKICDENGELVEEAKPSLCDEFKSGKVLYEMAKAGQDERLLLIAIESMRRIMQTIKAKDLSDLSTEEKSVLDEISTMDL